MNLSQLPYLNVPLFESSRVYLCLSREEWQQAHSFFNVKADKLDRRGAANTFKSLSANQDIHLLGWFDGEFSTLAHEAAHIVFDICYLVGIEVEAGKANETFCYLLDCIMQFAKCRVKSR
ncbi:hypothetical protein [Rodentibacter caecimuris]|uniref:hypothetical protein n=1 Tax=Rodentibacter caecimuris TaxID=1796644 RepID=UPI0013A08080|nr:hypothetical protein [Rodentibacter heylii]QIA76157.1 hypothetical protein FEE42_01705 [Rodentibacter heylii]